MSCIISYEIREQLFFYTDIVVLFTTYIIGNYNPSVRIIDLVSNTTYVVRVNYIRGGSYSLKSTPNDRF